VNSAVDKMSDVGYPNCAFVHATHKKGRSPLEIGPELRVAPCGGEPMERGERDLMGGSPGGNFLRATTRPHQKAYVTGLRCQI
jgi:hypothetical protein